MKISPVESIPLEELVLDAQNSRVHPAENLEQIANSLQRHGQTKPLLVKRDTKVVIAGNGTLISMRSLGWDRANVIWADCSENEAKAAALADNRTAESSEWDREQVQLTLDELHGTEYDMEQYGFPDDFTANIDAERQRIEIVEENALEQKPKQGKPIQLTREQREVFDRACKIVKDGTGEDYSEGRCLELMIADYLAGA